MKRGDGLERVRAWYTERGWRPFSFQEEVWAAYRSGKSGLIHAPTGLGKTLAAWLGPVSEALENPERTGLQVLWLTPLRALAVDSAESLRDPLSALKCKWEVAVRTGDSTAAQKQKLRIKFPAGLVTTPESLSLALSYDDAQGKFTGLQAVIVDEWHELLGTKRGVMAELCLARLRAWNPGLRVWGLSATIGNLDEAREVLLGQAGGVTISSTEKKRIEIETLLPQEIGRFPWAGHLGKDMAGRVWERIDEVATTLLFTNTRSQTEIWYQMLLELRPEAVEDLAMHHGSLDKAQRMLVEDRLRAGSVRCVVCTSSLDLGVDFSPVEQVIQIGSPKGIARILQRAGRSGHRPGAVSRVLGVPTNAFELVEFAAAREAMEQRRVESRMPLRLPLDLLVQHLTTVALGGGFMADAMLAEVQSTFAFRDLNALEWSWALDFITRGGEVLRAYPDFQKVVIVEGKYRVLDARIGKMHRLTIGTISADPAISVRFSNGRKLGTVEESFISKIKPGGLFIFGGKRLELVRYHQLTAEVRAATKSRSTGQIPSWQGGKSPLSTELARAMSRKLAAGLNAGPEELELCALRPILEIQAAWSVVPKAEQLLIEETRSKDGAHVFVFPFAGRLVHEGLGTLVAYRLTQSQAATIQVQYNDYGFALTSKSDVFVDEAAWRKLLSEENLLEDLSACMNTHELAKRQFREVARVAGLVMQGYPGQSKGARSLQTSSALMYDVFARYDPGNLLLEQSRREIMERQLEWTRLRETMLSLTKQNIVKVYTQRLTPLAFPLWAEGAGSNSLTTETFTSKLASMLGQLETAAQNLAAAENRPEL
jgi:ATP-dependent helicase Lhr and Lhr-like helicase